MSASLTSTLSHSAVTQSHGKPSNTILEAMDVNRDGQQPSRSNPPANHLDNKAIMNTATDNASSGSTQEIRIPGLLAGNDVSIIQQPVTQPVRDQPREEGAESSSAQEAQDQLAPLPQNAPLIQNPLLTSNLVSLYGLDALAKSVARVNPKTGEGNKLRKSYEGQLKTLGLSGRNKSVKHDDTKGMGLSEMAAWPEEEWQNQKVFGKDVKNGLPDVLKGKLEKAMQMLPGPVPNNDSWEELLGIDKVKPIDATKAAKAPAAVKVNGQQPNDVRAQNNSSASQPAEPIRARRTTKKRRYDEGSFEGYGEGYVDDEMEVGYSSGESRSTRTSAGNRKRRKTKDYTNSPAEYGNSRNNNFTAGPVGISAYGR